MRDNIVESEVMEGPVSSGTTYSGMRSYYPTTTSTQPKFRMNSHPLQPPFPYQEYAANNYPVNSASNNPPNQTSFASHYSPVHDPNVISSSTDYSRPPYWTSPPGISSKYKIPPECPNMDRTTMRNQNTNTPTAPDCSAPPLPYRAKPTLPTSNQQASSLNTDSTQRSSSNASRRPQPPPPRKRFYEFTCWYWVVWFSNYPFSEIIRNVKSPSHHAITFLTRTNFHSTQSPFPILSGLYRLVLLYVHRTPLF